MKMTFKKLLWWVLNSTVFKTHFYKTEKLLRGCRYVICFRHLHSERSSIATVQFWDLD